jgi:hypothetical protein
MNKIHLITFANKEPFIKSQKILDSSYKNANILSHTMWNQSMLTNTSFYVKNKYIFERYRTIGFGLYIWKPFIIFDKLNEIEEGEFIYYQDASQYDFEGLNIDFQIICQFMNTNNIELIPGFQINIDNKLLIKEECLKYLNYDKNENFLNKKHYHTSPLLFKKTSKTVDFIKNWLNLCQVPQCIIKNTRFHQCDQAIFNILLDVNNYQGLLFIDNKGESKKYSVYWKKLLEYIDKNKKE